MSICKSITLNMPWCSLHFGRLNVSSKSVAIFAAALTLLDSAVIPLVSAATATNYLAGEIPSGAAGIPFPPYVLVAMIIVLFVSLSMAGLKDSARMAFVILCFHVREALTGYRARS
jgi:amino acid transporter